MARSLFRDTLCLKGPAGLIPLAGAQVWFYEPNGGTPGPPISYPLYPDAHSAVTLPTPYVTGALGELEVWADLPHRAQIVAIKSGYAQVTETIDLEYPPELSATTDDIADAIRIHESEEDPHDQYLTQDEGDLRYLQPSQADDLYVNASGDDMTGPLTFLGPPGQTYRSVILENQDTALLVTVYGTPTLRVTDGMVEPAPDNTTWLGQDTNRFARLYVDDAYVTGTVNATRVWATTEVQAPSFIENGWPVLNQEESDTRYEQLSRKGMASGYVPLGADTKIPNAYLPDLAITNTFVVTSEAEMLALNAQTGDVCVRLDTTENYILAAEPATVLANWTKLAASTTAGNTTIVKREEFSPAAAATSVALAAVPTQMLSVSRNGVEQSQPAGHYTVAGVTVTFTDAFVAGERVSVVYEVGSSAPAPINGYTKLESDARYEPIDTMYTKAESDAKYALTAHNHDSSYSPLAHNHDSSYLTPGAATTTYVPLAGGNVLTGSLGPSTTGTRDLGSAASMWRALYLSGSVNFNNGGFIAAAQSAVTNVGVLRMRNTHLIGWKNAANTTDLTLSVDASDRYAFSGSNLLLGGDVALQRTGAGALRVDTHLGVGVNPASWNADRRAVQIGLMGAVTSQAGNSGTALNDNTYVDAGGVSRGLAGTTPGVMMLLLNGQAYLQTAPAVAAGAAQTFTTRANIAQTGTLTLTPDAGIVGLAVTPGGADNYGISISSGNHIQLNDTSNNFAARLRTQNGTAFLKYSAVGSPVGFLPEVDNQAGLGGGSNRWTAVYAVAGAINTSSAAFKEGITPLSPAECYQAAKDVRWYEYAYLPPVYTAPEPPPDIAYDAADDNETKAEKKAARDEAEAASKAAHLKMVAETAPARHQRGFVFPVGAESKDELGGVLPPVPDLFGLSDRKTTTPQADLATLGAALQELIRRFEVVEGKVV